MRGFLLIAAVLLAAGCDTDADRMRGCADACKIGMKKITLTAAAPVCECNQFTDICNVLMKEKEPLEERNDDTRREPE